MYQYRILHFHPYHLIVRIILITPISLAGISLVDETAPEEASSEPQVSGLAKGITVAYERPAPTSTEEEANVVQSEDTSLDDLMAQMKSL